MKYKAGDRLIHKRTQRVVEIIEVGDFYHVEYLDSVCKTTRKISFFIPPLWEYVGNFAKGKNFNSLYEKLSNP